MRVERRWDRPPPLRLREAVRPARVRLRSIFISDVHLGSRQCRAEALLDFLRSARCEQLYLVGDIIDLHALRSEYYWPNNHAAVLRELLRRAAEGTRVVYVPGNHDADLRDFVGGELRGVEVRRDCLHLTADERRLLVTHGDDFEADVACAAWLSKLGAAAYDRVLALHGRLARLRARLGLPYWSLAGYLKSCSARALQHIEHFEQAAAGAARHHGLDGIICGHIHCGRIQHRDAVVYANCGDWVENCSALVEDRDGRLALWHWPQAPGQALAAFWPSADTALEPAT